MFVKVKNWLQEFRLSLRMKLTLSLSAIAVVLLMSSIISLLEYRRMSNYVSDMMADNIRNIHVTQQLVNAVDTYNLQLLAVIGDDNLSSLPDFDRAAFVNHCDSLRASFGDASRRRADTPTRQTASASLADSVIFAYSAYMLASMELEDVLESNFINTRDWYFERLQPLFGRLRGYLENMSSAMYEELEENSRDFDSGFFRSVVPSIVAVSVGILLVFMLLFYILVYYVKPLYGMLQSLRDYLSFRRRYTFTFDGNDQLFDMNTAITDLTEENRQLRRRMADMKEKEKQTNQ